MIYGFIFFHISDISDISESKCLKAKATARGNKETRRKARQFFMREKNNKPTFMKLRVTHL